MLLLEPKGKVKEKMELENVYWQEVLEENELEVEVELDSEKEQLSEESSTCVHKKSELPLKVPGFDFTYIEKLLSNMETTNEKIKWLRNFKTQLQQSQKAMAMNSWTLGNSKALENQYKSVTPYIQTVSLAIRTVQTKIKLLKEELKREARRAKK